jgi:biotin carboxyl carrier protein
LTSFVEVRGARRTVRAKRAGTGWLITTEGRSYLVDAVRVANRWSLLVRPESDASAAVQTPARSYEVSFDDQGAAGSLIHIGEAAVPLAVITPRDRGRKGQPDDVAGKQSIVTPMAGRVVRVLVKPGDRVVARQGLVVVEAMKMENELRAARAGTVSEVRVTEGTTVDAKVVLIVLE